MISIKNSFADCSSCDLLDAPSCILETNCKTDLSKVDVIFISENPGKDEIKKGIPLIGRAGKTFRQPFDKYIKNKFKWLITNCVLCLTLDEKGNTGNPTPEQIERCKCNCFNIIEQCSPKLIILMGTSPMSAFGIAKTGITNLRGQFFKWNDYDVMITIHPSFVNRNLAKWLKPFEEDIEKVTEFLGGAKVKLKVAGMRQETEGKGIFRHQIPQKFYTTDYRLVDIQYLTKTKQIMYIFRDKDNKKVLHKEDDHYVCYQIPKGEDARKMVPYEMLDQVHITFKEKGNLDPNITYEGDVKLTAKHAMDYYHFNKGEAEKICMNVMFADIEIDAGIDNRAFPNAKEAKYPINMITAKFQEQDKQICYILDNKTQPITEKENTELKIFDTEKQLLSAFFKDWRTFDPDFACGWNFIGFDMEYIYNRMPKVGIPYSAISPRGDFYVDSFRFACYLPGCIIMDQDHLYKSFTFTKLENYKLGFVAQKELNVTKVELPYRINEMYWKDLNLTIEYSIRDTELLEKMENKLQHISLSNEIRVICNATFDSASSTFGQEDCLMVSFLRERGFASKNSDPNVEKGKYPGAYVQEPIAGIYNKVCDFDFARLYPSIIMTYNIGVNTFVMKLKKLSDGYDLAYHQENLPDQLDIIIDPLFSAKEGKISKDDLLKKVEEGRLIHTINGCFFKPHEEELSVYSEALMQLVNSRSEYKEKMLDAKGAGDEAKKDFFDTKQLVYKVLANSLYGVIATSIFRFFNLDCAAAITLGGQEALKNSITEGNAIMHQLYTQKPYEMPSEITKVEMYDKVMPFRKPEYIVTGDTDSIFVCFQKFKGITKDQILENCDKVQTFLNGSIMERIVTAHNVPMEHNQLVLKNELLINRGLFLGKKRYAIHVINNEGRDVDYTQYMGIEVKRSDYPSASKEFMKELIDLIMKSEQVKLPKLFQFIQTQERKFMKLIMEGHKTIGRPVSYGKKLKDYKMIPQGVRAMENFNEVAYHIHSQGSKGYMFRVSGIDVEKAPPDVAANYEKYFVSKGKKLEIVAIPDEEPKLPDYFIPDVKGNLKFVFIDRYELLLAPLTEVKKNEGIVTI
ncbi:hypothetical protein KAR91_74095 [Candidatus Pacearchaeota archaeon]|nr:hypothetical protein [Candidatus Pacearchaeota archaeon]